MVELVDMATGKVVASGMAEEVAAEAAKRDRSAHAERNRAITDFEEEVRREMEAADDEDEAEVRARLEKDHPQVSTNYAVRGLDDRDAKNRYNAAYRDAAGLNDRR
jgi:hypothetical protein